MRKALLLVLTVALGCSAAAPKSQPNDSAPGDEARWRALRAELPATPERPVTDTYYGTEVVDPYRWLEDGDDPAVGAWMKRQDQVAREFLDGIPGKQEVARRLGEILRARTVRWSSPTPAGGRLFLLKREPPRQQPFLVVADGPDEIAGARTVLDPNQLDPDGLTTIDWFRPSPDGTIVAVSLSRAGTEAGDLHFFDTATGAERFEVIPRVQNGTAGGDASWTRDGAGLVYTRYPRPGERPKADLDFHQQVWFHRLGTPVSEDRYELGRDFPRIAETIFVEPPTGEGLLAIVQEGDSGRFEHYLRAADGTWAQLSTYADQLTGAEFGPDGSLYLISLKGSPRGKIIRLPAGARSLDGAALAIPEQQGALQWDFYSANSFVPTADRLYASYQVGGPTELRAFTLPDGRPAEGPAVPPVSSAGGLRRVGADVLFWRTSYTEPVGWYLFDPSSGQTRASAMQSGSPVRLDDAVVERELAVSRDGTRVPFVMVRRRGTERNGDNPVLATAYGGYGISQSPGFDPTLRVWLDHGGVFVEAGVRGGGEYGEEWHRQGSGVHKQNTFDDFAAVLTWLVENRVTRSERLGIIGGSNGGILMGAMITQHPAMQKAAVSTVGVYDMLRNELTPNGQFNVPEYGSVTREDEFRALYAYSPYHHVEPGTRYPAVLLTAGANDPRVDPMNSRKLAARLQASTTSGLPVLLRVDYAAGHGLDASLDQRIATSAHIHAFLMEQLGM